MSDRDDFDPKELTFSEREGIDPLPERLKLGELPQKSRALLWNVIYQIFERNRYHPKFGGESLIGQSAFLELVKRFHVRYFGNPVDEFRNYFDQIIPEHKAVILGPDYHEVLNYIEYFIQNTVDHAERRQLAEQISFELGPVDN
ncbi:MAG: hypothetical protein QF398_05580 [Alphaproteobacteria bacterium]|nr:hypothetical protein [Alphaproteobacteria bacterium]